MRFAYNTDEAILGRSVLNRLTMLFDGPKQTLEI